MADKAHGAPTKDFFVGMLTRDIELNDAILDLLDNCLDGVVRKKHDASKRDMDYYSGYYSSIHISGDTFIIEDNCGGIPRDVAEKYAFRMGRPLHEDDNNSPTVGIYGIGMKRAIFKIGRSAEVITRHSGNAYEVSIPLEWATTEGDWDFPICDLPTDAQPSFDGTMIRIDNVHESIVNQWNTDEKLSNFIDKLTTVIQQSYSFIIQRGFKISINDTSLIPLPIQLLVSDNNEGASIKPFLFQQNYDDVNVRLAVGFYAPPPSPEEIDDENELKRSSPDAGWTVVCNDRVVLYNDKSHLTGWGEGGVPHYHTQFIGIRGIVIFESNNPRHLPMTTTKRGVDTSSEIYAAVKDKMRQGLKMLTDYTNRWKGRNEQERTYSTKTKSVLIDELLATPESIETNQGIELHSFKGGHIYNPVLPKPVNDKPYRMISFSKSLDEILDVVEYLYKDRMHPATPSQIGEKCFDIVLEKASTREGE